MEEQNTFAIKRIANIHLRVLKFLLHILGIFLRNILEKCEATVYEEKLLNEISKVPVTPNMKQILTDLS